MWARSTRKDIFEDAKQRFYRWTVRSAPRQRKAIEAFEKRWRSIAIRDTISAIMTSPRKVKRRERKTLHDEIADTEKRDQNEVVGVSISVTRGLFLHALRAMRDGDYGSVSAYVSDLIRRDKHIQNSKPANLDAPLHQPTIPRQSSPDKRKLGSSGNTDPLSLPLRSKM